MGGGQESEVVGQGKRRNKDKEDVTQENMFVRWREDIRVHREDEKRRLERGGKEEECGPEVRQCLVLSSRGDYGPFPCFRLAEDSGLAIGINPLLLQIKQFCMYTVQLHTKLYITLYSTLHSRHLVHRHRAGV